MSIGALGFLGISRQNSFGTASNSWHFMPIISEGLETAVEQLVSESIQNRFGEPISLEGLETTEGDIEFDLHPLAIGHFLKGAFGQSSATATGSAFQHEFIPRQVDFDQYCSVVPYTLQVYRGTGQAWQFTDCAVNKIEIAIEQNAIIRATAGMICRTASLMTATANPTFLNGNPWAFSAASISWNGVVDANIEALTISFENQLEGVPLLDGTKRVGRILRTGYQQVRVEGTMLFENMSRYLDFKNQNELQLRVNLAPNITSYNTMLIDIPLARLTAYPVALGGADVVKVDFSADGKYDTTSNYAIRVTLINTISNY